MVEITSYCHLEHPLVLVEGQQQNINEENEKAACSNCPACGDVVLSGASRFSCGHCSNVHLHEECARAPAYLKDHPFHPRHSYVLELVTREWRNPGLACALCKEKRKMFFYKCHRNYCNFSLDIKCALTLYKYKDIFVSGCRRVEFKYEGYQYPFIFLENHKDELKRAFRSWCHEPLKHSIYVSLFGVGCQVTLHKECFDNVPTHIDHPCHRLHTLFLLFSKINLFCEVCQKEDDDNFFYRCSSCKFDIHIDCIWPTPTIEPSKYHHEHPLNLVFKNDPFICNACGTNGKFVSYVCLTCHIQVHKSCTSLPTKIRVSRHDHVLLHKYYFLEKGGGRRDCQICFEQVKAEYGSYRCSKEDCCSYVVHVKCALEDDSLYTIIDEENQDDDDDDATNDSSITPMKWNERGEAIEVRHFNHDHNLVLRDKLESAMAEDDRACDGCMLPISSSTPFYYCSDKSCCNFFLHKTCAELPKSKRHWFSGSPAVLNVDVYWECNFCGRCCSGLFYTCYDYVSMTMCVRCAATPYMIVHQGHEHLLFYDHKCKGICNGCGHQHWKLGAFRCKECSFTLDFHCMTYPLAVRHKCDDHLLKLTYHDDNDDDEQRYCDVCEKNKDPNSWYYSCSTCDNSLHSECAIGKRAFLKDGFAADFYVWQHEHRTFKYVRKVDDLDYCSICGKRCEDDGLKCATTGCNFICHFGCRWG